MKVYLYWLVLLAVGWLFLSDDVSAEATAEPVANPSPEASDENSATPPAAGTDAPASQGDGSEAMERFREIEKEYKGLLMKLYLMQKEYHLLEQGYLLASEARKAEIDQKLQAIRGQWEPLITRGDLLRAQFITAAQTAYLQSGGEDTKAMAFLINLIAGHVDSKAAGRLQTDNYEEAARLTETLVTGGCDTPAFFPIGALAAYAVNDYDTAKVLWEKARKAGTSSDRAERLINTLAYHTEEWAREQELRKAEADDNLPRVLLRTSKGDIELELFENEAPNTVANFVALIERGFYDGLTFHRVIPGFMAQGGCPFGNGTGGPGYTIPCECYQPNARKHFRGSISMAHSGRDTGSSQFFIAFTQQAQLDGFNDPDKRHTVFGRVVKGMDVLSKIRRRVSASPNESDGPTPPPADVILEAKVLSKRDHPYNPMVYKKEQ